MKKHLMALFLVSALLLTGCSIAPVPEQAPAAEQPAVQEEAKAAPETPAANKTEEAPITQEKQIEVGGATEIKQEKPSILSEVKCAFGEDGPEKFSFRMTNMEDKRWSFSALSYADRMTLENPVVVLNALQITNGQLIEACGKRSLGPGESADCSFDLAAKTNTITRKSLRTGETASGNPNRNSLSLRTASHAAEVMFLCE
jgi:hypothetical protein